MPDKLNLTFTHPRTSDGYVAQVAPECTAAIALAGLQSAATGPFLDQPPAGRPYELTLERTQTAITPNMSFADAKVVEGDVIEIRQKGMGA